MNKIAPQKKAVKELNKERNSNLELYRIIVMLLIVAHHYVVNSGLLEVMRHDPLNNQSIFLWLFGMWGKIGINCFVMITGYFMCRSHITLQKFMKLLIEICFYKIIITSIFLLTGYQSFNGEALVDMFLPIHSVTTGFVSCFLLFYLFIPFLNVLINNITQRQHLLLVGLCLFIYTVLGTVPKIAVSMNYVSWFIVLYFISSYLRLYGFPLKITHRQWGWFTVASVVGSMFSVLFMVWFSKQFLRSNPVEFWFVADSNHMMAVVTALCSFMWFKDLKMGYSRIINTIATSTFAVLLIHANSDTMRLWLWKDILDNAGQYYTDLLYVHAVLSLLIIFMACIVIDYLRIKLIGDFSFNIFKSKNKY